MSYNLKIKAGFMIISFVLVFVSLSAGMASATFIGYEFDWPRINTYYETSDPMTIDFTLDFTCPYDTSRPIYIYIFKEWTDGDGDQQTEWLDILEDTTPNGYLTIGNNFYSVGTGVWRGSITHNIRVPNSGAWPDHEAECNIVLSIDWPAYIPPYQHISGPCCFGVFFRKKTIIEPIPVKDEGEQPILGGGSGVPAVSYLNAPSPNPFNPSTTIRFGLSDPSPVTLVIYDANGRIVKTFFRNEHMGEGSYSVTWNGFNDRGVQMNSGVYFARFLTDSVTKTEKLILLR